MASGGSLLRMGYFHPFTAGDATLLSERVQFEEGNAIY